MTTPATGAAVDAPVDLEELIGELAEEYAQRLLRGERPTAEEYAARYPAAAQALRQILPALEIMGAMTAVGHPDADGPHPSSDIDPISNIQHHPHTPATLGDFRLVREIGRGGMGVVYEAEQLSIGRRVALKVLPFAAMLDRQQLNRFKNEARAAGTLDHPNIVQVYSVGVERGVHYYAMHLVEGESLAQVIARLRKERGARSKEQGAKTAFSRDAKVRRSGARPAEDPRNAEVGRRSAEFEETAQHLPARNDLPAPSPSAHSAFRTPHSAIETQPVAALSTRPDANPREYFRTIARLGIQAAEALDHAHQNGILHRDVKPANLLVDDAGKLWVTDFGLARLESDAGMTMTGDLIGTLRYMSPEQALAKRVVVDHRSDVYSLGVTLYELLTLEPAFPAVDRQELLRQIAFDEPRRPQQVEPRIPSDLETIVLKALEKNPADRYSTGQDVAADLKRFVGNEPIHARPPAIGQRVAKWGRRHRTVVVSAGIAAAVIGVVIIAAFALSNAAIRRERNEKMAAIARELKAAQEAEAGAKLALCLNQFRDRRFLEAEALLNEIPPSLRPSQDQVLEMYGSFSFAHAVHQRWLESAHAHEIRFRAIPGRSDVFAGDVLLQSGPVFAQVADTAFFAEYRDAVLARKLNKNPIVAEQTCRMCLLLPANDAFLSRLDRMYEILEKGQVDAKFMEDAVREVQPLLPGELIPERIVFYRDFGALALAIMDYRRGAYQKAIEWCQDYPHTRSQYRQYPALIGATTAAYSVAAMAHSRLGQINEARTALAAASIVNQSPDVGLSPIGSQAIDPPYDRIFGDLFFREATAQVRGVAATEDQRYPPLDNLVGNLFATKIFREADDVDVAQATWYGKAADQDYPPALLNLGHCYAVGLGVDKNPAEATKLFRRALEQFSWTCWLTADAAQILAGPLKSADTLLLGVDPSAETLFTRAAVHFRAAQFQLAEQRLQEAIAESGVGASRSTGLYGQLLLAMTHWQLGAHAEARALLARILPDVQREIDASTSDWRHSATLQLLSREAEQLIGANSGPAAAAAAARHGRQPGRSDLAAAVLRPPETNSGVP